MFGLPVHVPRYVSGGQKATCKLFFYHISARDWTQSLGLATKSLYHWAWLTQDQWFFKKVHYLLWTFYYMVIYVLPVCLVHTETRRRHQILWDWVTTGCKLPCGGWELNPSSLEELSMLVTADPFLQSQALLLWAEEGSDITVGPTAECRKGKAGRD